MKPDPGWIAHLPDLPEPPPTNAEEWVHEYYELDLQRRSRVVGEGWWPILEAMHQGLIEIDASYGFEQVKQKMGTLRVYLAPDSTTEWDPNQVASASELIRDAEIRSARTCELCGGPATLCRHAESRHLATLCPSCGISAGYKQLGGLAN